ncbi:MAG: hypothetical protein JJ971_06850 [Balneolaceae bacterium]|nr:hypothetical protein [Balneolaceae bacterium]MBO6546093.1 hypothetical protein [Balneolaceae bacterium]MBO6647489.1 hypothetical protein [Balneolaceae bacterium]
MGKKLQDNLFDFMQKNVPPWSAYKTNSGLCLGSGDLLWKIVKSGF